MTTILAIDDNKNNLLTLQSVLEENIPNCNVITAESATNCIELAKQHNPDTILIDVIMPGIDGFEACIMLKSNVLTKSIPVILLTALMTDTNSKIKGLEAGAEAFLPKPIDTSELIAQTRAMIRIKKAEEKLQEKKQNLENMVFEQAQKLITTNKDYKQILDNLGEGIGKLDEKNNFTYINKAGADIFEYTKEELINQKLKTIFSEDWYKVLMLESAKAVKGEAAKFHINIYTKTGIKKTLLITAMTDYDEDGNYKGSTGIFRDVTKSLRDEKLLKLQFDLAKITSATSDIKKIADALLNFALQSEDIDSGEIYLFDKDEQMLKLVSHKGLSKRFTDSGDFFSGNDKHLNLVMKKKPVYGNYKNMLKGKKPPGRTKEGLLAAGIIPIIQNGNLIAVLNVASHKFDKISDETKKTIDYLVNQIKSALSRILAEQENLNHIAKYQSLVEGTKDAILTIKGGRVADCNKALVEMLNCKSKDDIIGKSPLDFTPKKTINGINYTEKGLSAIKTTLKNGSDEFEWALLKTDGTIIWVDARLSLFSIENKRFISAILHDLTNTRKQDEEIRKFKTITDSANYGCLLTDLDGNIIYCNDAYAQMHKLSCSYLKDRHISVFHTDKQMNKIEQINKKLIKTGHYLTEEVWHIDKQGNQFPTLMNGVLMKDDKNEPLYISTTAVNISDIKKYESDLKQALEKANESDKLKAAFLASISHELRTPLNAVIGFSQILGSELNHDEVVIYSNLIYESGFHLKEIVEDIFYFTLVKSGQEKLNYFKIDPRLLLAEAHKISLDVQKNCDKPHIKLKLDIDKGKYAETIISDKEKVLHIFKLLIKNAFKFTLEGNINIGFYTDDDNIPVFFVKDTGIGIPEEKLDIIFEFFRQADDSLSRKYEGTGIGLAITHKLIEMLGGKIWVESKIEKGSSFFFKLPLEPLK
ncbi:MAG: PAS domain S-box protein [Chlorobi bacterium]|nr:PAS domain S-box protein [Chlorobiota bacterium]